MTQLIRIGMTAAMFAALGCGGSQTNGAAEPAAADETPTPVAAEPEAPPADEPDTDGANDLDAAVSGTGTLPKKHVRMVIRSARFQVKHCYERELIKNEKLAGKVIVDFVIAADGTVESSVGTDGGVGEVVTTCVADTIKKLTFDKPQGDGTVSVRYPFVFTPQG